jgi:hypothetical protein
MSVPKTIRRIKARARYLCGTATERRNQFHAEVMRRRRKDHAKLQLLRAQSLQLRIIILQLRVAIAELQTPPGA